jgi:hypothetical protein
MGRTDVDGDWTGQPAGLASQGQHESHNPLEKINVLATTIQQDNKIKLEVSATKLTKSRGE